MIGNLEMRTTIQRTNILDIVDVHTLEENGKVLIEVESLEPKISSFKRELYDLRDIRGMDYGMVIHKNVERHFKKRLKKDSSSTYLKKLFIAQNRKCYLCGGKMSMKESSIDHVIPRSKGGKNTRRNLLLTHVFCNNEKSDRLPTDEELLYCKKTHDKVAELYLD